VLLNLNFLIRPVWPHFETCAGTVLLELNEPAMRGGDPYTSEALKDLNAVAKGTAVSLNST
jgi:hypothetical protein